MKRRYAWWVALALSVLGCGGATPVPATPSQASAAPFVASRERPFAEQMMDTMKRMDDGMAAAPMNGSPDHASQLEMSGAPLRQVQEWLGHSTIQMTMRSSQLSAGPFCDGLKRKLAERLVF